MILILILTITVPVLLCVAFFTLAERHIMASMQRRMGPHTSAIGGILQPFYSLSNNWWNITAFTRRLNEQVLFFFYNCYQKRLVSFPQGTIVNLRNLFSSSSSLNNGLSDSAMQEILNFLPFDFVCFTVGLLLGDAEITKTYPKMSNSRLRMGQSPKNDFFIEHVSCFIELHNLSPKIIKTSSRDSKGLNKQYDNFDKRTGKTYSIRYIYTKGLAIFNLVRIWWYPNGVKVVPRNIGQFLTPHAVALWYMSDGYLENGTAARFGTDGFTLSEVEYLAAALTERYGWNTIIRVNQSYGWDPKNRSENTPVKLQYRLCIVRDSMESFVSVVKPHCCPGAYYKFPESKVV